MSELEYEKELEEKSGYSKANFAWITLCNIISDDSLLSSKMMNQYIDRNFSLQRLAVPIDSLKEKLLEQRPEHEDHINKLLGAFEESRKQMLGENVAGRGNYDNGNSLSQNLFIDAIADLQNIISDNPDDFQIKKIKFSNKDNDLSAAAPVEINIRSLLSLNKLCEQNGDLSAFLNIDKVKEAILRVTSPDIEPQVNSTFGDIMSAFSVNIAQQNGYEVASDTLDHARFFYDAANNVTEELKGADYKKARRLGVNSAAQLMPLLNLNQEEFKAEMDDINERAKAFGLVEQNHAIEDGVGSTDPYYEAINTLVESYDNFKKSLTAELSADDLTIAGSRGRQRD